MADEGYIKFHCRWTPSPALPAHQLAGLIYWRQRLYDAGLIGAYPDGVGFGNISRRWQGHQFVISGSATGRMPVLGTQHFALVTDFDIPNNSLQCKGPVKASSESLSHAAVYQACPEVGAVVHIHSLDLWQHSLNLLPTTDPLAPYGTPDMALAIADLLQAPWLRHRQKLLVMGGHREGLIAFGADVAEAGKVVLER